MKKLFLTLTSVLVLVGCKEDTVAAAPSPVPALPAASVVPSTYEAFPGCETPSASYARTLYFDAIAGSDAGDGSQAKPFRTVAMLAKSLRPGDHVIFASGTYGAIALTKTNAPSLVASSAWVWIDLTPGATVSGVDIRDVTRVLVSGGSITKATGDIVTTNAASNVMIADAKVFGSTAPADSLTVQQWLSIASAFRFTSGSCLTAIRNTVTNVRDGFIFSKLVKTYPANSIKGLALGNELRGFSADGSRAIASDVIIKDNKMIDGYVDVADGDANHDDMFQGFALNGNVFENITVEGNFMQDRTKQSRNLVSNYQGINIFDGLYKNVVVRRNVVIIGAYHAINMAGVDGLVIDKNTVVSSFNGSRADWIGTPMSKTGVKPVNNVVSNNLCPKYNNTANATQTNNFTITIPANHYMAFDLINGAVDVHLKTTSFAYGKGAGAL